MSFELHYRGIFGTNTISNVFKKWKLLNKRQLISTDLPHSPRSQFLTPKQMNRWKPSTLKISTHSTLVFLLSLHSLTFKFSPRRFLVHSNGGVGKIESGLDNRSDGGGGRLYPKPVTKSEVYSFEVSELVFCWTVIDWFDWFNTKIWFWFALLRLIDRRFTLLRLFDPRFFFGNCNPLKNCWFTLHFSEYNLGLVACLFDWFRVFFLF